MRSPRWYKALSLAIFVAVTGLSLLGAEFVVRLIVVDTPLVAPRHHRLFCEYDPVLGWRKIPHVVGRHVSTEYDVLEQMNSRGLRGPEYSYEKRSNEYRILVLGDSFAEGYTVHFAQLFTEVLKRSLNGLKDDTYYQVINAGTGGYSTDQELLFFEQEGARYNPDLTILMFFANDVWFNTQAQYPRAPKPLFKFLEGDLRLTNVPVPRQTAEPVSKTPPTSVQRLKSTLTERSHLYGLIRDSVKSSQTMSAWAVSLGLMVSPDFQKGVPEHWKVWKRTYSQAIRNSWRITEALLSRLKKQTAATGSDLLVVHIPPDFSIYIEDWIALLEQYELLEEDWDRNRVAEELEEMCRRNEIKVVDLTQHFRMEAPRVTGESKRLYLPIDGHWSESGHRVVGEILAKYVVELRQVGVRERIQPGVARVEVLAF